LYYESGYWVKARQQDDNWAWRDTAYYAITDALHYVEVLVEHAASAVADDGAQTRAFQTTTRAGRRAVVGSDQCRDAPAGGTYDHAGAEATHKWVTT